MGHVSATTKLSERKRDRYNTPEAATRLLLAKVAIRGLVIEPCSGARQMSRVLANNANATDGMERHVITNDIDKRFKADYHYDFLSPKLWDVIERKHGQPDWVVTNPPFNQAAQLVPLAFDRARIGIAFFLRLSYKEPCDDRGQWLADHPINDELVLPRISFRVVRTEHADGRVTVSKTDNMTCAWYVWRRDATVQRLEVITKGMMAQYE